MLNNLPPDPDEMNNDRATFAKRALESFAHITGTDWEDALADLLCDLMHLVDRDDAFDSFDAALDTAKQHYQAETTEEQTFSVESEDGSAFEGKTLEAIKKQIVDKFYSSCEDERLGTPKIASITRFADNEEFEAAPEEIAAFEVELETDYAQAIEDADNEDDHIAWVSSPEKTGRI